VIRASVPSAFLVLVGWFGVGALPTSSTAAPPEGEAKPLSLVLRFTPGRELLYFVTTEKTVTQAGDEKNAFKSRTQYLLKCKVQSVSQLEATLQIQFDQIRWLPTGIDEQAFDSAKAPHPDEPPIFSSARSMIGKPFVVTMNEHAEILTLRPVDLRDSDGGENQNSLQLVGETQLRSLLLSFYSWMPAKPVLPHETWSRQDDMDLGFMKLKRTNTVAVVAGTYAKPVIESKIDAREVSSDGMMQGDLRVVGHLKASIPGKGTIRFDCQQGVLESIETSVAYEMTLESTDTKKRKAKPQVVSQRLQATTKVELRAVDGLPTPLAN
jgi:hypothetical protein